MNVTTITSALVVNFMGNCIKYRESNYYGIRITDFNLRVMLCFCKELIYGYENAVY